MLALPRPFAGLLALLLLVAPAASQASQVEQAGGRPASQAPAAGHNILVILIDDVGIDAAGTYAFHPTAPATPHLDALASQGLLFRQAHAQPVCSPTRATMLSGKFGAQTGVGVQIPYRKPDHEHGDWSPIDSLLPDRLPAAYLKFAVGKWHLDSDDPAAPIGRGFDEYRGFVQNLKDHYDYESTIADATSERTIRVQRWSASQEVDDALELIRTAPRDRPWFLWLGLHAAHSPWQAPPAHLHQFGDLTGASRQVIFRAMVQAVDSEIGRLLQGIDPEIMARTTVIVAGDNGTALPVQEAPEVSRGGKKQLYDGGTRVPLLIQSPLVRAPGREVDALVGLIDVYQTVLDLAGSRGPQSRDSVSLLPYLRRPNAPPQRSWVHARFHLPNGIDGDMDYVQESAMVRTDAYKLIRFGESQLAVEFYDLVNDPLETTNLVPGGNLSNLTAAELLVFQQLSVQLGILGGP